MSIRTNAKSVGKNDAQSAEIVAGIRKEWLKASDERKQEIALDFKIGYMAGREKISLDAAEEIMAEGKVSKKNTGMIDRAYSGYRYHIVLGKTKPTTPVKHTRIQARVRESAMTFLSEFEGKDRAAKIKQARAVLQALLDQ